MVCSESINPSLQRSACVLDPKPTLSAAQKQVPVDRLAAGQ